MIDRVLQHPTQKRQRSNFQFPERIGGTRHLVEDPEVLVDARFFVWKELDQLLFEAVFASAEAKFKVGEDVAIDGVWIEFDELHSVEQTDLVQRRPRLVAFAELTDVVHANIEAVAGPLQRGQAATEIGRRLEHQDRAISPSNPESGGHATCPAAHDNCVIVRHRSPPCALTRWSRRRTLRQTAMHGPRETDPRVPPHLCVVRSIPAPAESKVLNIASDWRAME